MNSVYDCIVKVLAQWPSSSENISYFVAHLIIENGKFDDNV